MAASNNKSEAKKPNIFVRMGRKIKEVFSELKRVTWPSFPKVLKSTGVVLAVVVVFLVVVTAINYGLDALLTLVTGLGGEEAYDRYFSALLVYPSRIFGL